jgi:small-conductance mechanosensitive channel
MILDNVIHGNITGLDSVIYGTITGFDLIETVVFLIIAILIARLVVIYLRRSLKDRMSRDIMEITIKVIYYTIIVIAVLFALKRLEIELSGLLVAGGIIGIVIGFATQSIVGNLVSGLFLMIERPIKIGDQVDIDGTSGYVEDIHTVSTIIRTYEGLYVRIPNEKVFTNKITNYVANTARRFQYVVGIRYSDDADEAIEIIKDLIEEHPIALKNPSATVFVDNLGDNAINIIVRIWAPPTEWYDLKMEMLWKIKKGLEENGIEIAFPQQTVWFANELRKKEVS